MDDLELINNTILTPKVQEFIHNNLSVDIPKLLLKKSPFEGITSAELAEQIIAKKKCKNKLPLWYITNGIYFPKKISIEQSSSESTALYKSQLVSGNLLDMTGGFGVDSYYFAKKCNEIIYCELQGYLSHIVQHNFSVLEQKNIRCISENSFDFLKKTSKTFDFIYIDPARRDNAQNKVFFLKDCEPNVPENLDFLWQFTNAILIKTSPMLDIQAGIDELSNVAEIHIVALNNEVKELLFLLKKAPKTSDILIKAINILPNKTDIFLFFQSEKNNAIEKYTSVKKYLYEPNSAIMKSGCFSLLCQRFSLQKIQKHSHLYTSDIQINNFQGRIFEIQKVELFNKSLKKILSNQKANVSTRNFPLSVEEIRKQFKIKEGGDLYLFFTTDKENEKIVIFCQKLKQ